MVLSLLAAPRFLSLAAMRSRPPLKLGLLFAALALVIYLVWFSPRAPGESFQDAAFDEASFGQRGLLAQKLYDQMLEAEMSWSWGAFPGTSEKRMRAEQLAIRLFPFIRHPSRPQDPTPLRSLRSTFTPRSRGIVIPAGKNNIIFARQAILALRDVLSVTLPITIAFAGNEDLPPDQQQSLLDLRPDVEMLDIMATLSDKFMSLRKGAWAVKPFAALASRFEQVILIDADVVFVQPPEILFDHPGYQETGVLFFHERQLEKVPGNERQQFLEVQTKDIELLDSCCEKILRGDYRDEQDSGVVVIDKRKLNVLIGLLHTCWQNSAPIRNDITYKIFYGDKESYWIGMALTKVPYVFEQNWAGIAGELREIDGKKQVCGNTISHSSDKDRSLIWYNGSLLRDKSRNLKKYMVPQYQIIGGQCGWINDFDLHFCCHGADILELTSSERDILKRSVEIAKTLDS